MDKDEKEFIPCEAEICKNKEGKYVPCELVCKDKEGKFVECEKKEKKEKKEEKA